MRVLWNLHCGVFIVCIIVIFLAQFTKSSSTDLNVRSSKLTVNFCNGENNEKQPSENEIKIVMSLLDVPKNHSIEIKTVSYSPVCHSDSKIFKIGINELKLNETAQKNESGSELHFIASNDATLYTISGTLRIQRQLFELEKYCFFSVDTNKILVKTCQYDCKAVNTLCVHVCCQPGQVYDWSLQKCAKSGEKEWKPFLYLNAHKHLSNPEIEKLEVYHEIIDMNCGADRVELWPSRDLDELRKIPIRVLSNGDILYIGSKRHWEKVKTTRTSCLMGIQNFGENEFYSGLEDDQILVACPGGISEDDPYEQRQAAFSLLTVVTMLIGSLFLLLTALVKCALWDSQNLHGCSVLAFIVTFLFFFIFVSISDISGLIYHSHLFRSSGATTCVAIGALAHFCFLSTFCWLSIINFDLWWSFRRLRLPSRRPKSFIRFLVRSLFGWLSPAAVIILGFILQYKYPNVEDEVPVPDYGAFTCFVAPWSQGIYLIYPIGCLLLMNLFFFLCTVQTVHKFRQTTAPVAHCTSSIHNHTLEIFAKLFVMMGITWIFECISWISEENGYLFSFWIFFDVLNCLQATGIFIIFVCKRNVISQLQSKYPALNLLKKWSREEDPIKIIHSRRSTINSMSSNAIHTIHNVSSLPLQTQA